MRNLRGFVFGLRLTEFNSNQETGDQTQSSFVLSQHVSSLTASHVSRFMRPDFCLEIPFKIIEFNKGLNGIYTVNNVFCALTVLSFGTFCLFPRSCFPAPFWNLILFRYFLSSRQSGECRRTRGTFSFQVVIGTTLNSKQSLRLICESLYFYYFYLSFSVGGGGGGAPQHYPKTVCNR